MSLPLFAKNSSAQDAYHLAATAFEVSRNNVYHCLNGRVRTDSQIWAPTVLETEEEDSINESLLWTTHDYVVILCNMLLYSAMMGVTCHATKKSVQGAIGTRAIHWSEGYSLERGLLIESMATH